MKLPFVPGPSDVIAAVEGLRDGVSEALALIPRVAAVVGRVETLMDRVTGVVDRVDSIVDRADGAIAAVGHTQQKADAAIAAVGHTQQKADAAIAAVGHTQQKADAAIAAAGSTIGRADGTVTSAEGLLGRMDPLVDVFEEPLLALAPAVRRLAASVEPDEVEAVVAFIDRLPQLMTHLDDDVLPVVASMGNVATDVHDLLDTMQDLRHVVKGFPGSRLFRRRGAEEIAEDEERASLDGGQEPEHAGS